MNRSEALKIARIAYRQIKSVIDEWESENSYGLYIGFHWDGCITIGEELFHEHELNENYQETAKTRENEAFLRVVEELRYDH